MTWQHAYVGKGVLGLAILTSIVACGDDDKPSREQNDAGNVVFDSGTTHPADASQNPGDRGMLDGSSIADSAIAQPLSDGATVLSDQDSGRANAPDGGDAAGASPCGGSCDDGVDCTADSCAADNRCVHTVDALACEAGFSCDLRMGCRQGVACSKDADCADMNGCTSNERCDPSLARCIFDALDADGDSFPPLSCGGLDCNDASGVISPSSAEICDGIDNNCNAVVDENPRLAQGRACSNGQPTCQEGLSSCGIFGCFNFQNDAQNCGACGNSCGNAGTCVDAACSTTCAAPAMQCGQYCSDLQTSEVNCGACGNLCLSSVGQGRACFAAACAPCGNEGNVCCPPESLIAQGCAGALSCTGTVGSPGATCECTSPAVKCGEDCADLTSDTNHCGACGTACRGNEACVTNARGTSCESCGALGEPCCALGCRGGAVCGATGTCVTP